MLPAWLNATPQPNHTPSRVHAPCGRLSYRAFALASCHARVLRFQCRRRRHVFGGRGWAWDAAMSDGLHHADNPPPLLPGHALTDLTPHDAKRLFAVHGGDVAACIRTISSNRAANRQRVQSPGPDHESSAKLVRVASTRVPPSSPGVASDLATLPRLPLTRRSHHTASVCDAAQRSILPALSKHDATVLLASNKGSAGRSADVSRSVLAAALPPRPCGVGRPRALPSPSRAPGSGPPSCSDAWLALSSGRQLALLLTGPLLLSPIFESRCPTGRTL